MFRLWSPSLVNGTTPGGLMKVGTGPQQKKGTYPNLRNQLFSLAHLTNPKYNLKHIYKRWKTMK